MIIDSFKGFSLHPVAIPHEVPRLGGWDRRSCQRGTFLILIHLAGDFSHSNTNVVFCGIHIQYFADGKIEMEAVCTISVSPPAKLIPICFLLQFNHQHFCCATRRPPPINQFILWLKPIVFWGWNAIRFRAGGQARSQMIPPWNYILISIDI